MKLFLSRSKNYLLAALAGAAILLSVQAMVGDPYFEISKNLEIFTKLFKELNTYYVDPIQPGHMMKKGIDAMLNDLDPYTNYITEEDIEDYRFQSTGKYGGIGCSVVEKDGYIVLSEPYENSPVIKAGLKAGDIITEIDGRSVKGKSVDDIGKFLKGSPGTSIKVRIRDAFTGSESTKTITREEISISSIPYCGMVGPNKEYAYLRLTQFTERCANLVRNALDSMKKANPDMKGIVLDLRSNPGGLLDEAVALANIFINGDQVVVTTQGKNEEWNKTYKTRGTPLDEKIPLTILVNKGSASASEIIAGTMQDLDRGVVIGQRSYGKGLVQTTRDIAFNSKLKVTTAKYYTPSGRCIQALDYSHRNEDGSVGEVPDSVKSKFKTRNGRIVMDGGGIEPDVKTPAKEALKIISALTSKFYLFDYATQYVAKHANIPAATDFSISDSEYEEFMKWLLNKDYAYKTRSEEALSKFRDVAEKENYFVAIKSDYALMEKALHHDKTHDLEKNKTEIKRLLEDEIVTRYYFQRGRYQHQLRNDVELKEAIDVLGNPVRYKTILAVK